MSTHGNGKLPYLPFYPRDFLLDPIVEAMNMTEVGCYITLLCKAWEQRPVGTLPCEDRLLARWCRFSLEDWQLWKEHVLKAFYFGDDGRWHQKRMEAEYAKSLHLYELKASNAERQRRFRARHQKESESSRVTRDSNVTDGVTVSDSLSSSDSLSLSLGDKKDLPPPKPKRQYEKRPENFAAMKDYAVNHGMTVEDAKYCWNRWQTTGWRINGKVIHSWKHAMNSWRDGHYLPSTKEVPK
jgi:uncharacterized protein YdaU (DUF1376 family)